MNKHANIERILGASADLSVLQFTLFGSSAAPWLGGALTRTGALATGTFAATLSRKLSLLGSRSGPAFAGSAGSGSQQAHAGSGPQRGRHAAGSGPRQQSASAHLMPESKRKIAERLRFHQESAAAEAGKLWDEGSRRNLGFGKATGDFPT